MTTITIAEWGNEEKESENTNFINKMAQINHNISILMMV
jgi:hypothetical protein